MKKLLLLMSAICLLAACDKSGDSSDNTSQLEESVDQIKQVDPDKGDELEKATDEVAKTTGRDNLCDLLTPQLVKSVFSPPKGTEFENNDDETICSYSWQQDERTFMASLNFSSTKPMSAEAAQQQWDKLKSLPVTKKNDIEPVSGVGEKAVWSKLGGGQLRVLAKGNMFYVSVEQKDMDWMKVRMGSPTADKSMTKAKAETEKTEARAESKKYAVEIAKEVVAQL